MPSSKLVSQLTLAVLVAATTAGAAFAAVPTNQTVPMNGSGDIADDTAVWLHPVDRSRSMFFGVSKSSNDGQGGIYVYTITGGRARGTAAWTDGTNWFQINERYNNVDSTYGFPAGSAVWDLVAASNRDQRAIDIFRVNRFASDDYNNLELVGRIAIGSGYAPGTDAPYGCAFFRKRDTGNYHAIISDKFGNIGQYRLAYNSGGSGSNRVTGSLVAKFDATPGDTEVEGIAADEFENVVYIAGEDQGIWRYPVDSTGVIQFSSRVTVASVGSSGLSPDVEGLTLYYGGGTNGAGYLIASSQGSSQYAVFNRAFSGTAANTYVKNFSITSGNGIDATQNTDGICVANANFGGNYTQGLFIAHDGVGASPTNYKIVRFADIADDPGTPLTINAGFNVR